MNHLSSAAFLILLAQLLFFAAHSVEPIETKWRQSIEADLRNGDPEGDFCTKLAGDGCLIIFNEVK